METSDNEDDSVLKVKDEVPDQKPDIEELDSKWLNRSSSPSSGEQKVSISEEMENVKLKHTEERARKSGRATLSEKKLERIRARDKMYMRKVRASSSADKKQVDRERAKIRQRERRARMTEEELQARREKGRLLMRQRRANLTEEELQAERDKGRLRKRQKKAELAEEELQALREKNKLRKRDSKKSCPSMLQLKDDQVDLEESKKTKILKRREAQKKYNSLRYQSRRLKETPEEREQRLQKRYLDYYARLASLPREEREAQRLELNERQKEKRRNHTPEERRKYLDCLKRSYTKRAEKFKAAGKLAEFQNYNREKFQDQYQKILATETPEQRWRRLQYYRINQATRKLRKKMREEGISDVEIEVCVNSLKIEMMSEPMPPLETISKHKPRPRKNAAHPTATSGASNNDVQKCFLPEVAPSSMQPPLDSSQEHQENLEKERTTGEASNFDQTAETDDKGDSDMEYDFFAPDQSTPTASESPCNSPKQRDKSDSELIEDGRLQETLQIVQPVSSSLWKVCEKDVPDGTTDHFMEVPIYVKRSDGEKTFASPESNVTTPLPPQNLKCPKCKEWMPSYQKFLEHYKSHPNTVNSNIGITKEVHEKMFLPTSPNVAITTTPLKPTQTPSFLCLKCPLKSGGAAAVSFATPDDLLQHDMTYGKIFGAIPDFGANDDVKKNHPKFFWPCQHCKLLKYYKSSIEKHMELCRKYYTYSKTSKVNK